MSANLEILIKELQCDARLNKDMHFHAAERKNSANKYMGITVVLINVIIGSSLIELMREDIFRKALVSVISFVAAAMAAIQTFFNYSKDIENHRKIGNMYLELAREADNLLGKLFDDFISEKEARNGYDALLKKYHSINKEGEMALPSKKDFEQAFAKNKDAKDAVRKMKEGLHQQLGGKPATSVETSSYQDV
ncbi:SLATT domain-containing protein [Algivirga pacifica]|uniref:SMODS and SLOG-associating 2TM effector domain-containing protein n=1 Tax=Algivirga pacifica TaxID=1162670 RepID=A0ABP9D3C7_9BACT